MYDIVAATGARAIVKFGAEGVFCAALPAYGLGVALNSDDGDVRAAAFEG